MKNLAGRTALLTGASGGAGPAVANKLAAAGMQVAVSGLESEILNALATQLRTNYGCRSAAVPADLSSPTAIDYLVDEAQRLIGPIDILVNAAGVEYVSTFHQFTTEELRATIDVNLMAPILLTRRLLPGMITRGLGHVVFISSIGGKRGIPYNAPYCASKAGLILLTQSLRAEYTAAPVGFSVVSPGYIQGAGMFQRKLSQGARASQLAGRTTPNRVATRVLSAIRHDRADLYANSVPVRWTIALGELAPRVMEAAAPIVGANAFYQEAASIRADGQRGGDTTTDS